MSDDAPVKQGKKKRRAEDPSDLGPAVDALKQPGRSAAEIEAGMLALIETYGRSERRALLDALLTFPLAMFGTLGIVRAALVVAERAGRTAELIAKFKGFLQPGAPIPHWNYEDRLKGFKNKFSFDLVDELSAIKYAQSPAGFATVAEAAEFYGPRFDLPAGFADALYQHTASRSLGKDAYTAKLREGFVVEHIINDLCRRRGGDDSPLPTIAMNYQAIWTDDLTRDPTRTVAGKRKAAVFLTGHSSLMDHVKVWYKTAFEDGVRLGSGASDKIASSRDNPNAALLAAYRAAMAGTPLLIFADSPMGTAKNALSVFGAEVPVADGFVFLSYESRADVFWTMAVLEGGRLVLRTIPGPSREDGETVDVYRARLLRFVSEQMEAYFAGPPEQIGVRKKWVDALTGSAGGTAEDAVDVAMAPA